MKTKLCKIIVSKKLITGKGHKELPEIGLRSITVLCNAILRQQYCLTKTVPVLVE